MTDKVKPTRDEAHTVEIKQVTPNGRILYDAGSILGSETAKHHIETLRQISVEQTTKTSK